MDKRQDVLNGQKARCLNGQKTRCLKWTKGKMPYMDNTQDVSDKPKGDMLFKA